MNRFLSFFLKATSFFWSRNPALLYALSLFLGIKAALAPNYVLLLPIALLFLPLFKLRIRLLFGLSLFAASFTYAHSAFQFPSIDETGIQGNAVITISSITPRTTHFGESWVYRGILKEMIPEGSDSSIVRNIPYVLHLPNKPGISRPLAGSTYLIHADLKEPASGYYTLKANAAEPWSRLDTSWDLVEWRIQAKKWVSEAIKHHIKGEKPGIFLAGIATGDFDDRAIQFQFKRFGLQHIMAISGFHFAIIAAIFNFILRFFLSKKATAMTLMAILTAYFVFLGFSPSIMRAWVAISVFLASRLIGKESQALNSLGVALLAILMIDPLQCQSLGFQFSFLATGAILFFFSGTDLLMQKMWIKRGLNTSIGLNPLNQHGYILLTAIRQAAALCLAVNAAVLPLLLYHFHQFPYLSLVYNLFFPFLTSISMLLLILGFLLPPLSGAIHLVNSYFTHFMLGFAFHLPAGLDAWLLVDDIPEEAVICHLCLCGAAGILLKYYLERKREERQDFVFI